MSSISPDQVRDLRGGLSRAAFAKRVGVTPHTIYRWELPDDAKEARRPRGAELARLERLRGDRSAGPPHDALASAPAGPKALPRTDEIVDALGALERIARGDAPAARADLLRLLTQARSASADARALAASGLALYDCLLRAEPRSALQTLSPVLVEADDDRLSDHAAAIVHAVAACAHALPDATLFDAGRVHAHAARAEELARGDHPEIVFLAWLGTLHAAIMVADDELLARAFARQDQAAWSELPPLLAVHEAEARSLRASFGGQRALAARIMTDVVASAEAHGYDVVVARLVAVCASRELDELGDPAHALERARRSKEIARASGASASVHTVFAIRAEAEALLRVGRTAEALASLDELEVYTRVTGLPPIPAVSTMVRVFYLAGRYAALDTLVVALRGCAVPSLRAVCHANARFVEAMRLLASSDDPEKTVEAFDHAALAARGWNFLLRDILVYGATAYVLVRSEIDARAALRRAQRFLDRNPSPWAAAHLRRVEGTLVAAHGQWSQAQQFFEAAAGTLEAGGDLADAAFARYVHAAIGDALGDHDGSARLADAIAHLRSLGLEVPASVRVGVQRFVIDRAPAPAPARGEGIEALVAPIQRLAVRGAEPNHVQRELVAVTAELLGGARAIRLEELGADGEARIVERAGDDATETASSSAFEWFEFGDGAGGRFRLGARGPLDGAARALLAVIGTAGGLALEVSTLRRAGSARSAGVSGDDDARILGFVAASPATRMLRAEIARLAPSRATVVIQGESGTGKEIVARAIHDLSPRAKMPYVAFNCAAVPRDLFEGQLFGYKRGAFTGAARDQPGVLRAADGGTIFLDEIGELPLDVQPKLLRFLENGEVFPLGEKRPQTVDVRVIAATHRDLATLVREHRFREDLYYRLQVIAIRIPPLRDRPEDIAPLARHFLRQLSPGDAPPILAPDALAKLVAHGWPGNVRELRNAIERALAYSPPPRVLRASHLDLARG